MKLFKDRAQWLLTLDQRASEQLAYRATPVARTTTIIAHSGDGIIWVALLSGVYLLVPHLRTEVLPTAIGLIATAVVVASLKFSIRRPRPQGPESAKWSAMPKHDVYSSPSGHAARAACLAWGASKLHPLAGCLAWGWAIILCWSRVSIRAHFCLDVVAGLIVGLLVGFATWALV